MIVGRRVSLVQVHLRGFVRSRPWTICLTTCYGIRRKTNHRDAGFVAWSSSDLGVAFALVAVAVLSVLTVAAFGAWFPFGELEQVFIIAVAVAAILAVAIYCTLLRLQLYSPFETAMIAVGLLQLMRWFGVT